MTKKNVVLTLPRKGAMVVPVKQPAVAPSKSSRRKRNRQNRAAMPFAPVAPMLSSQGGQQQEQRAKAMEVQQYMMGASPVSIAGKSSVMTILNPCGELGSDENAKFPDGTLSQSGVQRLRQFETIVAPWQTISSSANVTNNWSLYIISPACFRTIGVLIAVKDGRALTDSEFMEVFTAINNDVQPPAYPAWSSIGDSVSDDPGPNIYYSIYSFRSANLDVDLSTGESKTIESFRVVGDGMVVLHNTPDLWNQGSFTVGQFKTDFNQAETDTTDVSVNMSLQFGFDSTLTNPEYVEFSLYFSANGVRQNFISPTKVDYLGPVSGIWGFNAVLTTPSPTFEPVITGISDTYNLSISLTTFTFTTGSGYSISFPIPAVPGRIDTLFAATGSYFDGPLPRFNPSQMLLSLPSLNQDDISQADPKFSAELMKCHQGFYAVRRYFEPKLLMNVSNVSGPIKLEITGMDKQTLIDSVGGILGDLLDQNGSAIVAAIRGISYACSPTIKAVRFVEFLPAAGSTMAPFVGPCPSKDEDAEEIFRQVQLEGPHSYIPDANFLGSLTSFILGVVNTVPVFLRNARGISGAVVKALDWADSQYSKLSE